MQKRTSVSHRFTLAATVAVLLGGASLAACGGSSDGGTADDPPAAAERDDGNDGDDGDDGGTTGVIDGDTVEAAQNLAQQAIDETSADARATVVIDGVTYEFRALQPGPDDYFFSFCSTVAGSLQGGMQLVDDSGARIEGGELEFVFLEPGGLYEGTGDPAELSIYVQELGPAGFTEVEINAPASGRSASGTFVVDDHLGNTLSGTIDASC